MSDEAYTEWWGLYWVVRLILRSVFQGLDDIDKDEDAKQLISREISRFREAYKVAVTCDIVFDWKPPWH